MNKTNFNESRFFFIIPIYNEISIIQSILEIEKQKWLRDSKFCQLIIVDDGSSIQYDFSNLQVGFEIKLIRHPRNLGPGAAFKSGFTELPKNLSNLDYVVTLEGDGTTDFTILKNMISRLQEGYDIVLASPYIFGGKILATSTTRRVLSSIANAITRKIMGLDGIYTLSSFYRVYRGSLVSKVKEKFGKSFISRNGFEAVVEFLWKCSTLEARISEVPFVLNQKRRNGKSKMKILKTIWGYLIIWFNCIFSYPRQSI